MKEFFYAMAIVLMAVLFFFAGWESAPSPQVGRFVANPGFDELLLDTSTGVYCWDLIRPDPKSGIPACKNIH